MVRIEDAVIVVAHPDDEILWFSSVLNRCKSVIVCFGPSATSRAKYDRGRTAVIKNYPLAKVRFLNIRQSDANGKGQWKRPPVDGGFRLRRPSISYDENRKQLFNLLSPLLVDERVIFTHNPWGEYGHEEHIQVFDILADLKAQIGYEIYLSGYVGKRSLKTMMHNAHSLGGAPLVLETDKVLAGRLKKLYLQNDCWTWREDNEWPNFEVFYRFNHPTDRNATTHRATSDALHYISYNLDPSWLRRVAGRILPQAFKLRLKRVLKLT